MGSDNQIRTWKPVLRRRLQIVEGVERVGVTEMICASRHEPTKVASGWRVVRVHSDSGHVWEAPFARNPTGQSLEEMEECGVHS